MDRNGSRKPPDSPLPPTPSESNSVSTSTHPPSEPVESWNLTQVLAWLDSNNFSKFRDAFIEHDICGEVLIDLNYTYLKDMGIHLVGDRARILTAIKKQLRPPKVMMTDPQQFQMLNTSISRSSTRNRNGIIGEKTPVSANSPRSDNDALLSPPPIKSATESLGGGSPSSTGTNQSTASRGATPARSDVTDSEPPKSSYSNASTDRPHLNSLRKSPSAVMTTSQDVYNLDPYTEGYSARSVSKARSNPHLTSPSLLISPRSSSIKNHDAHGPEPSPISVSDTSPPSPGRDVYRQLFGEPEAKVGLLKVWLTLNSQERHKSRLLAKNR